MIAVILHLLSPRRKSVINVWKRSSNREKLLIVGFSTFGTFFWVGLSLLFWFFIDGFYDTPIIGDLVLKHLLSVLLLSLFGLLCFSNIVTALSNFYLSDDLELLLALPISREQFHFARLINTVGQSSWMIILLGLPILISYGLVYQAAWTYYLLSLVVVLSFVLIAGAFGVAVASILVSVFPARRIREALMLIGILCLIFVFVLLRWLKPERLADTNNFENAAAYIAELQPPNLILAPPQWGSDILLASLRQSTDFPWIGLCLLLTGVIATNGLSRWLTAWLYDTGRAKAQEARVARLAKSRWLDKIISVWTFPLSPTVRALVTKDIKTFFRDPSQWTQLLLVGSIVSIALLSVASLPMEIFKNPWMKQWVNALVFLILALVGFVMAALAARFQFSAVSLEGRSFWLVRTAPLSADDFLFAKAWVGFVPMLLVGQCLAVSSAAILNANSLLFAIAIITTIGLSFGLSGIAIGMGAMYPNFKIDNAAKLAASPSGLLYMVIALSLVFATLALEAPIVFFVLSADYYGVPLTFNQKLISSICVLATFALWYAAAVIPMKRGAKALWNRELPNG